MLVLVVALISGCSVLQKLGFQKNDIDEIHPVSFVYMDEIEAARISEKIPVRLYFTNEDNSKLMTEIRYIKLEGDGKNPGDLASEIVRQLIKGPGEGTGLKATIPEGTELRSPVTVEGKVATVDLTKEFIDNHPGGKDAEKMTIYSIVNSLTQVKNIEKIKFTIEGKTRDKFKGNFKFDAPFPGSPSLNSKEPPVKSKKTADEALDGEDKETSGEIEEEILE